MHGNSGISSCGEGRRGFTLLELMLSVAILGVITAVVTMTLSTGVESWRVGTSMADEAHHADAVMEQLVMALRSAYYPEASSPTYEYGFRIEDDGNEPPDSLDTISWVKVGNSLVGEDVSWAGAAHRVEVFVSDDPNNSGLFVKAWQLVGLDDEFDPEEDVEPVLLSDKVVSLNCRMLDPDKKVEPFTEMEWLDEWTASNRIPYAVELTVAVAQPGEDAEPAEFKRIVHIPMADLSWNPIDTAKSSRSSSGRGNRGNSSGRPVISGGGLGK